MADDSGVPVKVEREGSGGLVAPNAAALWMAQRRELPVRSRPAAPLLERLLVRAKVMPPEVRRKAPKRVQEAMQVVEDYVAGLPDGDKS